MVVDFSIAFGLSRSSTKLFISFERPAAPSPGATQSSFVVTWWTVSPAIFICCGKLLQTPSSTMAFPSEWFGGRGTVSPPTSEVPSRGVVGGGGGRAYENGRGGTYCCIGCMKITFFCWWTPSSNSQTRRCQRWIIIAWNGQIPHWQLKLAHCFATTRTPC